MNNHPHKAIRAAIEYAISLGWSVQKAGPRAHVWGMLYCPLHEREGCRQPIFCTPRNPENHAKHIRHTVDRCPHH